ncbi:MAG: hypothetical protein U1D69_14945 [Polynucleobacter sp.]|nr:hypothetical protein [Polynucleobacter sp.]
MNPIPSRKIILLPTLITVLWSSNQAIQEQNPERFYHPITLLSFLVMNQKESEQTALMARTRRRKKKKKHRKK